jgi:recombination protein RecA
MAKKKAQETQDEKKLAVKKVVDDIKKKWGSGAIDFAEEYDGSTLLRRPTGILSLDIALNGGWPAGLLVEVVGPEGVGKTTLLAETCKQIQAIYGDESCIALAMIEPWDKAYWKNLGVHVAFSNIEIKQAEEARGKKFTDDELAYLKHQVGTIVHEKAATAEDLLGMGYELTKTDMFQLCGYDSIGAMQTKVQSENDLGEKVYAGASAVITDFVNKTLQLKTRTTSFVINQLRQNLKAKTPYDKEFIIPGGQALRYVKAVSVLLKKGEAIRKKISGKDEVIGRYVNWAIEKGKLGIGDTGRGSYAMYKGIGGFPLGIDKEDDIATEALKYEIVIKDGEYKYKDHTMGKSFEDFVAYFKEHTDVRDEIARECVLASGVQFIVK